jgi:hypothetical protein
MFYKEVINNENRTSNNFAIAKAEEINVKKKII